MYNGKPKRYTFLAKAIVVNDVLDWFEMETKVGQIDNDVANVTVKTGEVSFGY